MKRLLVLSCYLLILATCTKAIVENPLPRNTASFIIDQKYHFYSNLERPTHLLVKWSPDPTKNITQNITPIIVKINQTSKQKVETLKSYQTVDQSMADHLEIKDQTKQN